MKLKTITLALACLMCAGLTAQNYPYQDSSLPAETRADDLLGRLNLEQKVSLMMNTSPAIPEFGIREYDWWNEALHGCARAGIATVFPQAIGMASSWDEALLKEVFTVASDEQRIKFIQARKDKVTRYHGLTVWTPNINIFRDPRWGRGQETYGEDPYLTARMGYSVVTGLQGENDGKYDKLHACLKHYAVHSGPEGTRHSFDVSVSYRDLMETYLYAFERLVKDTDVQEVMCAYQRLDGKPCCGNDQLLGQLLRDKWGFKGIVVSDCGAISDFFRPNAHGTFLNDPSSATANAVRTGTDLECGGSYKHLIDAVAEGKISEKDIDVSLKRLLVDRFMLGEMDPDDQVSWNKIPEDRLACAESRALSLKMARETMVLLQNDGILPLGKSGVKYAVIGPNAADSVVLNGNYNGTPVSSVTAIEGIRAKVGAANVTENTDEADIVIYVGGISPKLEGEEMRYNNIEGFDRGDRTTIELPSAQRKEIAALKAAGKKVVLVNMSGSAMGLLAETKTCAAILQAWYPGEAGGTAIADVLFGDYNPAGRLPVTFYRSDADLPDINNYDMAGRTYRFFEGKPLFEFGYGLSYTTFKYGRAKVSDGALTVKVSNTGKMDGDEVVQLYVKKSEDKEGPKMALRGFRRVHIPAGQTVEVSIPLTEETFKTYNAASGEMEATPGHFTLYYGSSSSPKALKSVKITR